MLVLRERRREFLARLSWIKLIPHHLQLEELASRLKAKPRFGFGRDKDVFSRVSLIEMSINSAQHHDMLCSVPWPV
jgi:hypothetical protein